MNVRKPAAALFLLLVATVADSETAEPESGSPAWFFRVVPEEPLANLRSADGQTYMQALPAVGRTDVHAALDASIRVPGACEPLPEQVPVVDRIVGLARQTSIVIINEAHDIPRHRDFVRRLAQALEAEGYDYFAAEAFSTLADDHPAEAFARTDSGYYIIEPVFGRLIRTVKGLGYRLVPYEHIDTTGELKNENMSLRVAAREEGQARNLVERIFRDDPDARALVHVGYSHAAEVPIPSFDQTMMPWMAARLKEKTGIDPLTIDQTNCASATDTVQLTSPTPRRPSGTFDLAVAWPPVTFYRGRPEWRIDSGANIVDIPDAWLPTSTRMIIEARYADEPDAAVPLDRLLLAPGDTLPLLLPPGRIRLTLYSEAGEEPQSRTVVVE